MKGVKKMIKLLSKRSTYLRRDESGKQKIMAELICDTAAELIGVTEIDDCVLAYGSIAIAAKEEKLVILASDNKWYSEGTEVTADA